MEEIYIVKLKGLPPPTGTSQESLSKDSKTSFYYHTDLTAEAIRGFSFLHIFFGLTVLCLSVTNLCFHENPLALEPPLGITIWCAIAFILLGLFGMITAYKRKCDLSRSIFYVKIHFTIIVVVLSMTLTFVILFAFDLHGPIANQFIGLNIFFSIIVETVILLLTLFTCARVLWPGCINFCAKDWPMQPKLKRKVIVKTNVFANGIQQDDSSMIQTVGPNCVISLNMPPISSEPQSAQMCTPSSSCSKEMSNLSHAADLSSAASHLTNSSPSLYSMNEEESTREGSTDSELSLAANSVLHSAVSLASSYPLSGHNMQTFPNDANNRNGHSNTYGNMNRLLYQHSHLFKRRSYLDRSTCTFDHEISNRARSDSEEMDPYDTDEFDYCSTDEDELQNKHQIDIEGNRSSSDDGNSTLEEDNKSSGQSDHLSSSHSESDLNQKVNFKTLTMPDIRHSSKAACEPKSSIVVTYEGTGVTLDKAQSHEVHSEYNEIVSNNAKISLPEEGELVDCHEGISLHGSEGEDEDERDEGISSSGSSTCSGDVTQSLATHFTNRMRLQTYSSKQPYKSSIKIESRSISLSVAPQCTDSAQPVSSDSGAWTDQSETQRDTVSTSNLSRAESTTTIRLLTTKSTASQPKQKVRIDLSEEKTSGMLSASAIGAGNPIGSGNKLASHPYLCRLRASNADCFERRYPKYSSSTNMPCSSVNTTSAVSVPADDSNIGRSRSNLSVNFHEQNRIPDIQRV